MKSRNTENTEKDMYVPKRRKGVCPSDKEEGVKLTISGGCQLSPTSSFRQEIQSDRDWRN